MSAPPPSDPRRTIAWLRKALLSVYRARDLETMRWGLRQVIKALVTRSRPRPGPKDLSLDDHALWAAFFARLGVEGGAVVALPGGGLEVAGRLAPEAIRVLCEYRTEAWSWLAGRGLRRALWDDVQRQVAGALENARRKGLHVEPPEDEERLRRDVHEAMEVSLRDTIAAVERWRAAWFARLGVEPPSAPEILPPGARWRPLEEAGPAEGTR